MTDTLITEDTRVSKPSNIEVAETERGALNPRAKSHLPVRKGNKFLFPVLAGMGFLAVVGVSVSGKKSPQDSLKTEKEAAETADQAAKAVVQDPLGNRPLPDHGPQLLTAATADQIDEDGHIVPAIETDPRIQTGRDAPHQIERAQQLRDQAQAQARARRDAMRRAPLMALAATRSPANAQSAVLQGDQDRTAQQRAALREPTPLESRLTESDIATVRAGLLANRNFLIAAGTVIPCVLQTAMDSTLPGLTSCVVPRSVLSDNGRIVLLEKGTRVLGEYQGGLQQGQNRIFIVWNRAITPRGVTIDFGSPAADQLGRAGMGGQVETFFLKRFGGALLLSIVGDLGSAASDRLSGANETSRAPSQAAGIALQNDLRIQPRLRAPQGAEMTIIAARDVDFSSVYSLKLKR